jgi:pyruvate,water dikinase
VRLLGLDELRAAARTRTVPADLHDRVDPATAARRPLPAQFRLTPDNTPVAVAPPSAGPGGVGAGGGVGSGPVHVGDDPPEGAVLVVTHLDPRLATVIPRLAGLVAETGSPLSHLAILAREHGVPTVVGHADATGRYRDGQVIEVDGTIGAVRLLDQAVHDQHADDGRTTVITLPTRPVVDLADDDADERADSADSAGGTIIPIGARR